MAGEKGRKGDKLICKQQTETNCSKFEPVWFVAEVEELNCSERNSGRGPGSRDTRTRETDGLVCRVGVTEVDVSNVGPLRGGVAVW